MKLVCFVLLALMLFAGVDSASQLRLCGAKLMNTLKRLCNQRSRTSSIYPSMYAGVNGVLDSRQHVVEVCCLKPCSYGYLQSLCAPSLSESVSPNSLMGKQYENDPFALRANGDEQFLTPGSKNSILNELSSNSNDLNAVEYSDLRASPGLGFVKVLQYLSNVASRQNNQHGPY